VMICIVIQKVQIKYFSIKKNFRNVELIKKQMMVN